MGTFLMVLAVVAMVGICIFYSLLSHVGRFTIERSTQRLSLV